MTPAGADVMRAKSRFGALAVGPTARRRSTINPASTWKSRLAQFAISPHLRWRVIAVLCEHSILDRTMVGAVDWQTIDEGIARAQQGRLLHHLSRALALMGNLAPASEADYLSGLLIGHEYRCGWQRPVL
jgi:hypothetical protein